MSKNIDSKVFEILVREHHRRFLAYSLSLIKNPTLAEDIVQDSLLAAFEAIETFDVTLDFPAWVRGIIRNKYYEYCRKNNEILLEDKDLEYLEASHNEWDNYKRDFLKDPLTALHECLKKLPETFSRVVNLFYMQEMNTHEVAMRLSMQDATVRKRLQRARESLGECVDEVLKEDDNA